MDYAFAAMCGTLWPGWWRGPKGPGDPIPWLRLIAGIIGGVLGWAVLGPELGRGGGYLAIAAISVVSGNFLAEVVDAATGNFAGARAVNRQV